MHANTTHPEANPAPADNSFRTEYRNAMARLGAAVNIVTTDGPGGRAGFAATAVCSVTDEPPSLLVCINRNSSAYKPLTANQVLCVNVTSEKHRALAQLFGGKTPIDERFAAAEWSTLATGAPVLDGALESFDCHVQSVFPSGTHDILVCTVAAIKERRDGRALVYFERNYHAV